MIKKIILLFGFILLVSGCAGLADYDIDLPGNYSIVRTSGHEVSIAPKIGEGEWGANIVPAEVVEAGWNKKYIIAKQKNLDNKKMNYWIIDVKTGKEEKFLNKSEFEHKLKKYNINAKMKEVDYLR